MWLFMLNTWAHRPAGKRHQKLTQAACGELLAHGNPSEWFQKGGFLFYSHCLAKSLCHSNISLSHRLPLAEGWLLQGGPSAAGFPGAHHIWSSTALLNFCPWMSELGTLSVVPGNSSSSKDCCQAGNAALSMLSA